jgi:multiple sugar transport system substrate-binding protein
LLAGLSLLLNACGPAPTTAVPATNTSEPSPAVVPATKIPPTKVPTKRPPTRVPTKGHPTKGPSLVPPTETPTVVNPTLTPIVDYFFDCDNLQCLRWFVGLGLGSDPSQIPLLEEFVYDDFNASQEKILLILETVPHFAGRDILSVEIASGNGPDIVGPARWGEANYFYGQWLDLSPYIQSQQFDTSIFDPALVEFYRTKEGQVSLPFSISPGGLFFVPAMFDKAGLAYPPQKYGEKYKMPNGKLVDWNWDTVEKIAKLLTLDQNGKNATEAGFDRTRIVQFGYVPQWQSLNAIGTYDGGPSLVYACNEKGEARAAIPDTWKQTWQKYSEAMWGDQPWMPTGPQANLPEFGGGNVFSSGRAAMALTQLWYTCCLSDFANAGYEFQVGIIPMSADGLVHGRVDEDSFRIWKGTPHPDEAFEVLTYLITQGSNKLLPIYGGMPAIASQREAFFTQKSKGYPFVTPESWEVFEAGTAYPDNPSAESWMPNPGKSTERITTFEELLDNTPPDKFDFEAEFQKLEDDLTLIFNKGRASC